MRASGGIARSGVENLSDLLGVVCAELADFARKASRVQGIEHRLNSFRVRRLRLCQTRRIRLNSAKYG